MTKAFSTITFTNCLVFGVLLLPGNKAAHADNLNTMVTLPLTSRSDLIESRHRDLLEGFDGDFYSQAQTLHQQVDALYQGYGTHYIDLWVGTPPQRQTVIVGTASRTTGFPCAGCVDCGENYHTDRYFDPNQSSTYTDAINCKCQYGLCSPYDQKCYLSSMYAEGSSWEGLESTDITYAGGPHNLDEVDSPLFNEEDPDDVNPLRAKNFAFDHTFACIDYETSLFKTQLADGIMGMDNAKSSFWHQAYDAGVISKKAFALCLSRKSLVSVSGTEAGALTMGGHDKRLHTSPMVYANLDPNLNFVVNLKRIYLREGGGGDSALSNKQNLRITPLNVTDSVYDHYGKVLVDSGTTDTYFPIGFSSAFKELWEEMAGRPYSHDSMFLTPEEVNNLPTILLQLEGHDTFNAQKHQNGENNGEIDTKKVPGLAASVDSENPFDILVAIPPSHYMQATSSGYYVARFYIDDYDIKATIGANTMMGHDVLFDVEEGLLGFAESHCDYTQLEKTAVEMEENNQDTGTDSTQEGSGEIEIDDTDTNADNTQEVGEEIETVDTDADNTQEVGEEIGTDDVVENHLSEEQNIIDLYEKGQDSIEESMVESGSNEAEFDSWDDSNKSDGTKGVLFTIASLATLFVGGGYFVFERFGGKEIFARRHGRVPISELTSEYENELELSYFDERNGGYVNPMV